MSDLGIQLRTLMFVLVAPFMSMIPMYGFDRVVVLYAFVAMFLSIAVSVADARARR